MKDLHVRYRNECEIAILYILGFFLSCCTCPLPYFPQNSYKGLSFLLFCTFHY